MTITAAEEITLTRSSVDPITLEVVRCALVAYADEMASALRRTAYNPMIFEVQDYCVGLVDTEGELIAQNLGGLPIFLADLGVAVADGVKQYGGIEGFEPGDALIMNQADVCGQHLNNVVVYTPCFVDGKVFAFLAVRAHWADIGGARIGFGSFATSDIYSEGLQFRNIKILKAGEWNQDILQIMQDNLRLPESSLGDLRAAIAACRLGERLIAELAERYSKETIDECITEMRNQSEKLSRHAVSGMKDGEYFASSWMDNDGKNLDKKLPIDVRVVVEGSDLTIDFSNVSEQVDSPMNCGESGGIAAARVAFKILSLPTHPVDEGSFRNLHVILPEGKILNAKAPAALGLWSTTLPTVVDTILAALATAMPSQVPAAHKGDMSGFTFYGSNQRTGSRFVALNISGGGWGGRPHEDGPSACVSVCQGDVRNIPIEIQESRYPLVFTKHQLRKDSGGAGLNRGGLGLEIDVMPQQEIRTNVNNERTTCPPWGLAGGLPGATNQTLISRPGQEVEYAVKSTGLLLEEGSSISFRTAGGGGWGDPLDRAPARVLEDVLDGLVSHEAARESYGVVIADGRLDDAATVALREQQRSSRSHSES